MAPEYASLAELEAAISDAMLRDRFHFRRQVTQLRAAERRGEVPGEACARLASAVAASVELRRRRQASVPRVQYDEQLPIVARRAELLDAFQQHRVVIVCGATGSGKSTQLPKMCLELGRGVDRWIGHTQPRRLAARAVAARLAQELNVTLGREVGYKIRFHDRTHPETYVKLMTDGVLLAETQSNRWLDAYDTIIVDEAHERSLNIDFLLGYLKRLLAKRHDLRVIVTSATLDAERFSRHFGGPQEPAPIIQVSGRTYPVEVRYAVTAGPAAEPDAEPHAAVIAAVGDLLAEGPGDALIFLPTERDIREAAHALRRWSVSGGSAETLDILPLYARLSDQEQQRIFQPHAQRRLVLATNVAESSLTVPGIRFVIDTGTARVSRYSPRSKVQRLPIEPISQASAAQRAGRCGRLGPGICMRLYGEDDLLARDLFATPEIRRTNLAGVILQTKALHLGPIESFPFLDPPRPDAIRDGYATLFELGALDQRQQLTAIGRHLSRLPVDPRIGRMILAAESEGCLNEVLIIAAALEIQDPRERPVDKAPAADAAHAALADERSDFLGLLHLWDFYQDQRATLTRSQLRQACGQHFLSFSRLREWSDIHRQLKQMVVDSGRPLRPRGANYAAIHRALLTGLLSGIAYRREAYQYTGAGNNKLYLWPGSSVFAKRPKWIVAAQQVETSRRYARMVAEVDPAWIEPLAEHLVQRRHVAPFWSRRRGMALVHEKVSLFGLPLVTDRIVPLAAVDTAAARTMFIRKGLVEGQCATSVRFLHANRRLLRTLQLRASKARRTDWIIAEQAQFDFYEARLPPHVYDLPRLCQWLPPVERQDPDVLRMRPDDLLPKPSEHVPDDAFPDELHVGGLRMPLDYRFEPGSEHDGVTVTLPDVLARELDPETFEWLVPGRLEEKITALIRTLPPPLRRALVPAPDSAREAARRLPFGQGPFLRNLARTLEQRAGEAIPTEAFQLDAIPQHLRVRFRIVDEHGTELAQGRDLAELQATLPVMEDEDRPRWHSPEWQREGLVSWDFETLPEKIDLAYGSLHVTRYPALVDQGDSVSLRLLASAGRAQDECRRGIRRLFVLAESHDLRDHVEWMPRLAEVRAAAARLSTIQDIDNQIVDLLADRALLGDDPLPRTRASFQQRLAAGRERLGAIVHEITGLVHAIFVELDAVTEALARYDSPLWSYACADVRCQVAELTASGFLADTPLAWLQQFPRYFKAAAYRLERLSAGSLARDQESQRELDQHLAAYRDLRRQHQELDIFDPELETQRWLLEEFRVSLFAQHLGTRLTVSSQRLDRQRARIR